MSSRRGLVLRARSGFYTVETDDGDLVEARLRGRMKKERQASDLAVIGDRVTVDIQPDGTGAIDSVEPREHRFSRRQPGPRGSWREDVMVANADLVVAVFACDRPPPNPRLIDRFLVVAEYNEVPAMVVANKVEIVPRSQAEGVFEPYRRIGYDVLYTSAKARIGLDELRDSLAARLSIVTGPSGVGKSTLLNAIQPGLQIATAEVSEALSKGRHTTTVAELHRLDGPRAGYVADTPGIRELGLWQIPPTELASCFPEFREHLGSCGFNDCTHLHEPRCGLRDAVAAGSVSEQRYDSYRRMLTGEATT
ncbi:MAG TPA: ribosome small subunit-dependent GTPase A [Candidatus Limnocylindria bacterium]